MAACVEVRRLVPEEHPERNKLPISGPGQRHTPRELLKTAFSLEELPERMENAS